jgi:NAD(P)H-hydrate epimerase
MVTQVPSMPPRPRDGHKGTFGTVLVIAGSEGMLGAAILCARGALRGGAGLVRVALPKNLMASCTVAVPAATTLPRSQVSAAVATASAIVMGPGLGVSAGTQRLVTAVLRRARVPVVLDADALQVFAPLHRPLPGTAPKILLPHPGEAGRLLACDAATVQRDRMAAVAALAQRSGAVAVLKGEGTLVTDGAQCFHNRTGNPGMATGGTGDVLAGLCGALLAQGMDPFAAACLAVHVHGKAGDLVAARLSEAGLCAEDLPLAIAEVLRGSEPRATRHR